MILAICLFLSFGLLRTIIEGVQKNGIVSERKRQLAEVQAENQRLKQEIAFADSPEFLERVARDKLGLAKEGETVVLMSSPAAVRALRPATEPEADAPSWRLWWKLFF